MNILLTLKASSIKSEREVKGLIQRFRQEESSNKLLKLKANYSYNFWFLDGTHQNICRPSETDDGLYGASGHCLKYRGLVLPNGMFGHVSSAFEGNSHDTIILERSKLLPRLEEHLSKVKDEHLVLYGDKGYANINSRLLASFKIIKHQSATETFAQSLESGELADVRGVIETSREVLKEISESDYTNRNDMTWVQKNVENYSYSKLGFAVE
ncbi:unnamed protein product [Ambrosiozyma monospora]|uniref:Unnamed protein product n=1 Tax=Ambrosiozyma monospora TaxID=43982 RepID=A0ACB5SVI6_AMBMO|nr:unnamed protein product [Ambrosiozyma monospora]